MLAAGFGMPSAKMFAADLHIVMNMHVAIYIYTYIDMCSHPTKGRSWGGGGPYLYIYI